MNDYTALPNQLFRDLREGKINNAMFDILAWLHMRADYATGIVRKVSAKRIQAEMWGDEYDEAPSLRTIQKWMKVLQASGYIESRHVHGTRRSYEVILNNYCTAKRDEKGQIIRDADGDAEEIVLRPMETSDYRELSESSCADDDAEPSGDRAVTVRGTCGEPSAYTLLGHHPTPASTSPSLLSPEGSSSGGSHAAAPEALSGMSNRVVPDSTQDPALREEACNLAQSFWTQIGSPVKYQHQIATKWRDLIYPKVQLRSPDYVAGMIAWTLESDFWYPRIKNSRSLDPMEFFVSKFETLEGQRETDEEMGRRNRKKRPARNVACGSAAAEGAPEYRKERLW
jgi:hypothetical protein